ncbi:hypothetical protein D5018_08225 [Parashewanella curva]|uniref:Uncharacterized protein n=1 Tax=Parashewanella curva TaxID=2338552 RepID=A0A3L8PY61_9GAMM|nr:hypothetical protein [Parashewanella curva]RLV60240.1 hypothetical protein D5018_08225 [Parashewanella curva]
MITGDYPIKYSLLDRAFTSGSETTLTEFVLNISHKNSEHNSTCYQISISRPSDDIYFSFHHHFPYDIVTCKVNDPLFNCGVEVSLSDLPRPERSVCAYFSDYEYSELESIPLNTLRTYYGLMPKEVFKTKDLSVASDDNHNHSWCVPGQNVIQHFTLLKEWY